MKFALLVIVFAAFASPAAAQHQHGQAPYAGLQQRPIKALSEQQTADLRAGRGMGLALAAELNGYPGPVHVLELGDQLRLTDAQRGRMQALKDAMTAEAIPVGEKLVSQETALDRAFADRTISPAALQALTGEIGQTHGALRAVHLKYHLTAAAVLTDQQMMQYRHLRGYQ
jgi:hypothetical protein